MSVGNPEFVAEAQEIVEALNRDLIAVEQELRDGADEVDPDRINTLFRSAHSLKGISGMFGLEEMQTLAHERRTFLMASDLARSPWMTLPSMFSTRASSISRF